MVYGKEVEKVDWWKSQAEEVRWGEGLRKESGWDCFYTRGYRFVYTMLAKRS